MTEINKFIESISNVSKVTQQFTDIGVENAFSISQLKSKKWLIEKLLEHKDSWPTNEPAIYILGGWVGSLALLIDTTQNFPFSIIRSFDIDERAIEASEILNKNLVIDKWRFKATCKDMYDINYEEHEYITLRQSKVEIRLKEYPDIIINTCLEHIDVKKWWSKIPAGKLCVLQSNDFYEGEGHISCVDSLEELKEMVPVQELLFAGELDLGLYKRFMVIGIK